ncbi:Glucose/arabinose dehydrogenase, beta-propeller fold [Algoriphagus locisalis]|uniref:Glucose/arabinose dehydrogenase, beta-propeller fold n=1 Tax=Algoriphagus locisalis TaxID=305507 RepID=A0A1I6YED2_9BACT|nr:discoidin domain-containing protein [Algoriphagus locisalis]SFT48677.1 Glucose/arabinose dehydrogenase, beta-propeller fold [Algoriphagus locisalis]
MRIPNNLILTCAVSLAIFASCTPEKSPFDVSPADSMDPKRLEQPYPAISIPEDADMESPVWKGTDLSPQPPVIPVSANEQLKSFVLQPGYKLEPILSEPQIREPAAIQFDGNGRMYVLELRTYMQDIDATGELMPTSRISRWEDTDNDGVYDNSVIFLDSLVFPRYVVPFGKNTILSMESNEDNVYKYTDTDGDGKADKKELFASGLGRSGNVEHQTSFLTWTLDNWMYSTYNSRRIRWTPDGVIQEPAGNPWGQWGVTQDNYGQTWFQDGAGGVPQSFQFPLVYGNFGVKGQYKDGFREPFSLVKLADFQPGMRETKPDGSLNNVTGSAGNDVFRGDRLPQELQNKYFYGEPVGRIVRQVNTEKIEGLSYIQNPYREAQSEFIQSTDPLFRPVDIATAPDGTMYIVDMYRGIIQQGNWTQDGSYLRTKIQQYQMDDIAGNGRIWRLTYEGMERNKEKPRMLEETSAELVRHLSNPNGWWRDKAQQLIVLNQDKSVAGDLEKLVTTSENELARIHALWTLEGLNALKLDLVKTLMKDKSPQMRIQALRASESLYKYGEKSLAADYREMIKDSSKDVALQALLSANVLKIDQYEELIKSTLAENQSEGIQVVGTQLLERIAKEKEMAATKFEPEQLALFNKGRTIFDSYCATCHGPKGLGTPTGGGELIAPAFSGSQRLMGHPEYAVKTLLHGLNGALDGKEYEGVMIAMDSNDDEYIASVVSYIRNDFGNSGSFVSPEYVAQIRKETEGKQGTYEFDELVGEIPKSLTLQDNWKITASSTALQGVGSTKDPSYAFSYKGWKTDGAQEPGMWFQVELPTAQHITEVQFDAGGKEFPIAYSVSTSSDGKSWTKVAEASGNPGANTIQWKAEGNARFLKIESSEQGEQPWAMKSLTLYAR